ncbi:MAG: aminopeptidase [Anaerolineae bacterium]|nr:aminopeptidase [Anaerolineae bacterium]
MPIDRVALLAEILVDHSLRVKPGERVLLEGTIIAEPLLNALYELILQRGGNPHPLIKLPSQDQALYQFGAAEQITHMDHLRDWAYENFEARINIHSLTDLEALAAVPPQKQALREQVSGKILSTQLKRSAAKEFKWVTTLYPTAAYAQQAGMSLEEYQDFVFAACLADGRHADPAAEWQSRQTWQAELISRLEGHDKVEIKGPNVDLAFSIKGRKFLNSHGRRNMPDGEIHSSPVEDSVDGWVRFSYPAIRKGRLVEGVELTFQNGVVAEARAEGNQDYLLHIIDSDPGARRVGEIAIGTNYAIQRFTGNILFDEKIGGTFHLALGSGYPESGSQNTSSIHWDMICDLREDSQILVDGELIYQNGKALD